MVFVKKIKIVLPVLMIVPVNRVISVFLEPAVRILCVETTSAMITKAAKPARKIAVPAQSFAETEFAVPKKPASLVLRIAPAQQELAASKGSV
jgi:hypothetical protein